MSQRCPHVDPVRPPPREATHGPHFGKAMAQEQYWNSRGSTEVWDPYRGMGPVAARPETHGLAHSYDGPRLEQKYTEPYKKLPNPYTARTKADYTAYKGPSEGCGGMTEEVGLYKNIPVGRKVSPHDEHRDSFLKGKNIARDGRDMANV